MTPLRLLIVDDHEMVREGLTLLLSEAEDITVVGQAGRGSDVLPLVLSLQPDVVLLDLFLPDTSGVEVTRQLKAAGSMARVLILTSSADGQHVKDALQAGATGYLLKDLLRHDLLDAIRAAAQGRPTLHPVAQAHLVRATAPAPPSPLDSLTERERAVLKLLAEGNANKEIALALGLTVGTVKGYVSIVLNKLNVADRTQATLLAIKYGLVDPNQS
jgi:DNA-binding NarL/FixJ family response regulator